MHSYLFDTELVRIAILLGVIVSMLCYNKYGVTTGGAIVPGYLALFVPQPSHIVITLLLAIVTYQITQKFLRPRFMLWGRQLFEAEIVVTLLLQCTWIAVLVLLKPFGQNTVLMYGIGFLIPGIIAHDMGRQGVRATLAAAVICMLIVFGSLTLLDSVRTIFALPLQDASMVYHAKMLEFAYPIDWLPVAVVCSVLTSIAMFRLRFFDVGDLADSPRSGGFVTAGYLALFIERLPDLVFILVCSILTYLIVTQFLMRIALLFGRSKMAAMFLTAMIITWLIELLIARSGSTYIPWVGFSAITPTIVALLANDSQRQGIRKTLLGAGLSTLLVLSMVSVCVWLYSIGLNAMTSGLSS